MEEKSALRRFTDRVYGGIRLSWPGVILYAVGAAVLTTVFLVLPLFKARPLRGWARPWRPGSFSPC